MKRTIFIFLVVGMAAFALATGGVMKAFMTKYNVKPDSNLGKAKCMVCHSSMKGGKLNSFGKDLDAAIKAGGGKPSAEAFAKVEKLDSNKNGVKNGDEIKKDKLPGN